MGIKIKIKRKLDEMSSMGGGAVQGYAGSVLGSQKDVEAFNKKGAEEQRLKGERLDEMFSSQGLSGRSYRIKISGEKEHAGHVERSRAQGLRNVMEAADDTLVNDILKNLEDGSFFDTFSDDPDTSDAMSSSSVPTQLKKIVESFYNHGYKMVRFLGKGMVGRVVQVEGLEDGGKYAAKIIGIADTENTHLKMSVKEAVRKEMDNYNAIKSVADDEILKHFPEIYDSWEDDFEGSPLGFIVMEMLLPANVDDSALIPDVAGALARKAPKDRIAVYDVSKDGRDQSTKAKTLAHFDLRKLTSLGQIAMDDLLMDWPIGSIDPEWKPEAKKWEAELKKLKTLISTGSLLRYRNMREDKVQTLINKRFSKMERLPPFIKKSIIEQTYGVLSREVAEAPFILLMFLDLCLGIALAGAVTKNDMVNQKLDEFAMGFINQVRSYTDILVAYTDTRLKKKSKGGLAPGKDLFNAITSLYEKTGLIARDVHANNVMKRATGELVIVDLGLFAKDPNWGKSSPQPITPRRPAGPNRGNMAESRFYHIKLLTNQRK